MGRALILGVVLGVFYYFLLYDSGEAQKAAITTGVARIEELNAQIADAQRKLDAAAVHKKTAAEVGGTLQKLLSSVPVQFGMNEVMRLVSNEAKVAGVSLIGMDPRISESSTLSSALSSEFEELGINVKLEGSFLQLMVFLSNLTKANQILIVRKFEIAQAREGKGDEAPVIALSADIMALRYKGVESKPPGPQGGVAQ